MDDAARGLGRLGLPPRSIGLLRVAIDEDWPSTDALAATLSEAERNTSLRFVRPDDRRRAILGRGLVRRLVGICTDTPPRDVEVRTDDQGKPFVPDGPSFNVAHSGRFVLVGIGAGMRLGVDVEARRPVAEMARLVTRFFSPEEDREWSALPPDEREAAFFRVWARKEAFVKAIGRGLSYPLHTFTVSVRREPTSVLRFVADPAEKRTKWYIRSIDIDPTVEAAVANDRDEFPLVPVSLAELEARDI